MARRKQPAPPPPKGSGSGCFLSTILLAVMVVVSMGATFYFLFLRTPATQTPVAPKSTAPQAAAPSAPSPQGVPTAAPDGQTASDTPAPEPESAAAGQPIEPGTSGETEPVFHVPSAPQSTTNGPRLAIIIDDIGNTKAVAEQIIALDLPLTFSILPHTPHANHLASLAKARGHHLLVHLPMEPTDPKWSGGPGTLLLAMSKDDLISTINQDLDTPYRTIGINNHMGSKFTDNAAAMRVLLSAIKAKDLFFIDSLTSINSVGYSLAQDMGVKSAKRDVFLDNEQQPDKIEAQIDRAIGLAHKNGSAIAIGHPYPATLEALRAAQGRLRQEVGMVPVHELVH